MDSNQKLQKLVYISKEIENCKECRVGKSGKAVPGEGNPNADIVFLGEAPGKTEAKTGRPFIGRSGKLLRLKIAEIGLKEEDVFITSPVKYLPDSGTPNAKDIEHGKIHLDAQIKVIEPKLVVLLGSTAVKAVLSEKVSVTQSHGKIVQDSDSKLRFFITVHPAAAMRFPKIRKMMDKDFKNLKKLV